MNPTVCIKLHMDMEYSITLMQKCSHMLNFFAKKKCFIFCLQEKEGKEDFGLLFETKFKQLFYVCTHAQMQIRLSYTWFPLTFVSCIHSWKQSKSYLLCLKITSLLQHKRFNFHLGFIIRLKKLRFWESTIKILSAVVIPSKTLGTL